MKPASLPISLTKPIPYSTPIDQTQAERIALMLYETAVSKPKDLSMTGISLSMVLGTPTIEISSFLFLSSSAITAIPLCVPSPPITQTWLIPLATKDLMILSASNPPLELPKIVPPWYCTSLTNFSYSFNQQFSPEQKPIKPNFTPHASRQPYIAKVVQISRITTFKPGQSPPQVTIAAFTQVGLKCRNFLGPASNQVVGFARSSVCIYRFFSKTNEPLQTNDLSGMKPWPPISFFYLLVLSRGDFIEGMFLKPFVQRNLRVRQLNEGLFLFCKLDYIGAESSQAGNFVIRPHNSVVCKYIRPSLDQKAGTQTVELSV